MWLTQHGYTNVVSPLGSFISAEQEALLANHFSRVLLMLDSDDAGKKGIEACLGSLAQRMYMKVVCLPEGKQPDTLSADQLQFLLG